MRAKFSGSSKKRPGEGGAAGASKKGKTTAKAAEDSDDDVSLLALPIVKHEQEEVAPGKGGKDRKRVAEGSTEPTAEEKAAEKALKAHNDKLFAIRGKLKAVSTSVLKQVLSYNEVNASGGDVTLQARCADIMLHGVPGTCPQVRLCVRFPEQHMLLLSQADAFVVEVQNWALVLRRCEIQVRASGGRVFAMPVPEHRGRAREV